jgi:hypothetical protein
MGTSWEAVGHGRPAPCGGGEREAYPGGEPLRTGKTLIGLYFGAFGWDARQAEAADIGIA